MPVQQQMSSFAKQMGRKVAEANAEHAGKPVDTGNRRLPAGIRDGIAKLSTMYCKEYEDDKGGMKGKVFFRASAIVVSPAEFKGEKIEGMVTSIVIPMCDKPAKGKSKAVSFTDNFCEFQNVFKLLGVPPCPHTPATDPTGMLVEAYYFAQMQALTDPLRARTNPVFISFSTRGWSPPPTPGEPKPEEMVFETWHGLTKFDGKVNPAAGVTEAAQPDHMSAAPPLTNGQAPPPPPQPTPGAQMGVAPPPPNTDGNPQQQPDDDAEGLPEKVAYLVDIAMGDPRGTTDEGAEAHAELEALATALGWTEQQTAAAADWAAVGAMALTPPIDGGAASQAIIAGAGQVAPAVGSKWQFAKRLKDGSKLKDATGKDFPTYEVEVVAVNSEAKTCHLKLVKDGKPVVDMRSRKPVDAKWEWLEGPPY